MCNLFETYYIVSDARMFSHAGRTVANYNLNTYSIQLATQLLMRNTLPDEITDDKTSRGMYMACTTLSILPG